jgi:hypothetical protein
MALKMAQPQRSSFIIRVFPAELRGASTLEDIVCSARNQSL